MKSRKRALGAFVEKSGKRAVYHPPQVVEYGDLRSITRGSGGKKNDSPGPKSKANGDDA